ncbi:MAG: N-acetyl-alpha-D-glucosaminyl L-malate synthase BshA, partial [Gemmatimonadota bacterium]
PPYSLALAVAMHDTAVRSGLDLLHVHYAIPHATSAWIARELLGERSIRVMTTLHGTDITLVGQDPSYHPITRFSIQKSDGLTAVSEYLRRETVDRFDVPPERIRVIPNFVDLEEYRPDREPCHRSQFARPDEKILMHISNFRPVKRVDDAVRVFARVARELPARLLLVGDGPDRGRAQETATEEGVADRVLFLGKQESVAELLACADLFLLPSRLEAFGLVALEAMACGVPVVGTRVGGVPEVVSPDAGHLAPVGAIEEMASAAVELLSDEDRFQAARQAARANARRFDAKVIVAQYEAYYQQVLNA